MSPPPPPLSPCARSEVEHVRKFLACAKVRLDETRYYPPVNRHRYLVALALYSKCITVGEATLVLLDAGFNDEAFGMTRTMVEISLTLRYISNDPDNRALRFVEFGAKESEDWAKIAAIYWPQSAPTLPPRTQAVAATFPKRFQWADKPLSYLAYEPDAFEIDLATGQPTVHDLDYRVIYHWSSKYVHVTIGALRNHLVQAGRDNFTVRARDVEDLTHFATFNIAAYVLNTMVSFHRCMGDDQDKRVATWGAALIRHLSTRHFARR
jgi:hypothetical protein